MNRDTLRYFNGFRVEHIPKEINQFTGNKNITTNIFRKQACNSIMCGYIYIGFMDFMLKKRLLDYTNLFSRHKYGKNDKIILKYF